MMKSLKNNIKIKQAIKGIYANLIFGILFLLTSVRMCRSQYKTPACNKVYFTRNNKVVL